jgi:hypothetical protein
MANKSKPKILKEKKGEVKRKRKKKRPQWTVQNELVLDSAPQGEEGLIQQKIMRFVTHFMSRSLKEEWYSAWFARLAWS